jgi:hypothetical protein
VEKPKSFPLEFRVRLMLVLVLVLVLVLDTLSKLNTQRLPVTRRVLTRH